MSNQTLFIPKKINVGFQTRKDTYTGKLAYIIYYDQKGKLRKETSWNNWRSKDIHNQEFDNEPTSGFVLNKGVGGARQSYGWNARNEYIRVYDPRGFEFEISVANLLFILRECDCSRGKGLEGEFIYSWDGTELVLIPIVSQEYKKSIKFTELQHKKISAKELVEGATYITKNQENYIYLGRFDRYRSFYDHSSIYNQESSNNIKNCKTKSHIFINCDYKKNYKDKYVFLKSMTKLSACKNTECVSNYAELVDEYYKSIYGSEPVEIYLEDKIKTTQEIIDDKKSYGNFYGTKINDNFYSYNVETNYFNKSYCINLHNKVFIKDGILHFTEQHERYYPKGDTRLYDKRDYYARHHTINESPWEGKGNRRLLVKLKSGKSYPISYDHLMEK